MRKVVPTSRIAAALSSCFTNREHPGIVSVYLFGSHASGRPHRESDVDVAVLLDRAVYPGCRERFQERVRLTSELMGPLGTNEVDVVILNDAPPALAARIVTTGARVFCSDPGLDRAFVRDSQLRAADLLPFMRRTRRVKLAGLLR